MKYRTLGKTRLKVSEVGFGCGNVGGLMVRGAHDLQCQAVKRALELGINYFDTAPSYGDGLSEAHVGEVFAQLKPSAYLATKVGLSPDHLSDINGAILRSLEASLRRLQRNSVDVFQLHNNITQERGERRNSLGLQDVLGKGGVAEAFAGARSQGLVRFLGFTALGSTQALHQVVASGVFDVVQIYYNAFNPSAGYTVPSSFSGQDFGLLIDKAAAKGMGIVVIRALAGGALGGEEARQGLAAPSIGGALAHGAEYDAEVARAKTLARALDLNKEQLPQFGLRFVLSNQSVSTVLVGFSSLAQIEEAAACSGQDELSKDVMQRLQKLWHSNFQA